MMKQYIVFIASSLLFFTKPAISIGQLSETNKLLHKASFLRGSNKIRNQEAQNIYNLLMAKEPTNAVIYAESGFFNLLYADKELGMIDLNVAMYLLENKLCACDYEHIYNIKKEEFFCSLELLEKIYEEKRRVFYEKKQFDSTGHYIKKLVRLYTDSSGTKPDYSKFKNNNIVINKLNGLYTEEAENFGDSQKYQDALKSYQKIIFNNFYKRTNTDLIDLYAIVGEYDSILQIMNRELFVKKNADTRFAGEYPILAVRYFFDYLSAYIAKRDFEPAYKLITSNTTYSFIPDTKSEKGNILLKEFPMYMKGESSNFCERINQEEVEYSYFYFYHCLLNDLNNKNYENALLHLNNFYKLMAPQFLNLAKGSIRYLTGESYKSDYIIFSLKGYLLSKLNKKTEAKLAYQEALKLNPACKEAVLELKAL